MDSGTNEWRRLFGLITSFFKLISDGSRSVSWGVNVLEQATGEIATASEDTSEWGRYIGTANLFLRLMVEGGKPVSWGIETLQQAVDHADAIAKEMPKSQWEFHLNAGGK